MPETPSPGRGPATAAPGSDPVCDLSTTCMLCGTPMAEEHAHYRCPACGWRDSCCM